MVTDTSRAAFNEVKPELGDRQQLVLNTIKRAKRPVNDQEIADFLRKPINTITPRRNELVSLEAIELAFKATYPVTNRKVCYWRVK